MAAMMAGEAVDEAVLDHPCGAVRALAAVAAGAAGRRRREAAAIEEEKALLALFEPVGERSDERRCEPADAVGLVGPHVERREETGRASGRGRRWQDVYIWVVDHPLEQAKVKT